MRTARPHYHTGLCPSPSTRTTRTTSRTALPAARTDQALCPSQKYHPATEYEEGPQSRERGSLSAYASESVAHVSGAYLPLVCLDASPLSLAQSVWKPLFLISVFQSRTIDDPPPLRPSTAARSTCLCSRTAHPHYHTGLGLSPSALLRARRPAPPFLLPRVTTFSCASQKHRSTTEYEEGPNLERGGL